MAHSSVEVRARKHEDLPVPALAPLTCWEPAPGSTDLPVPALAPSRTIVKSTYIISDLSSDVRNTADFSRHLSPACAAARRGVHFVPVLLRAAWKYLYLNGQIYMKAGFSTDYLICFDFENTGYVFGPEKSTAIANYPISGDF